MWSILFTIFASNAKVTRAWNTPLPNRIGILAGAASFRRTSIQKHSPHLLKSFATPPREPNNVAPTRREFIGITRAGAVAAATAATVVPCHSAYAENVEVGAKTGDRYPSGACCFKVSKRNSVGAILNTRAKVILRH